MKKMFLFVLTLQLLCCSRIIAQYEDALPIASHFKPSKLANLTLQEEHQLQLKALLSKDPMTWSKILAFELYAKGIGNEFYSLMDNETMNQESSAIFKAATECLGKLPVQFRVLDVLMEITKKWKSLCRETARYDQVSKTLYNMSLEIDNKLKHESIYTTLRDEYKKSKSWRTRKIFLYSIPKSEEELQAALAQLVNDPLMKKLYINIIYVIPYAAKADFLISIISCLANNPGKLEAVQKIYDEMVVDVISLIPFTPANKIDLKGVPNLEKVYGVTSEIVFRKLGERITKLILT